MHIESPKNKRRSVAVENWRVGKGGAVDLEMIFASERTPPLKPANGSRNRELSCYEQLRRVRTTSNLGKDWIVCLRHRS